MKKILDNLSKLSNVLIGIITIFLIINIKEQTLLGSIGFTLSMGLFWFTTATKMIFSFYNHAYLSFPSWTKKKMRFALKKVGVHWSVPILLCLSTLAIGVTIINLKSLITTPVDKVATTNLVNFTNFLEINFLYCLLIPCIALILHKIIARIAESIMAKESPPS
jgi:hypothetical protein